MYLEWAQPQAPQEHLGCSPLFKSSYAASVLILPEGSCDISSQWSYSYIVLQVSGG